MAHDVFISYSFHDKHVADAICTALESAGIRCWIAPRDVLPGKEWGEAIVDAIGASRIMVLVFSSASNNSQQVLREVERAVHKNLIIVPFRIENVLPTRSMEYFLYSTHWLDALTPELERHIEVLIDVVSKLLDSHSRERQVAPAGRKAGSSNEGRAAGQPVKRKRLALLIAPLILVIALAAFLAGRFLGHSEAFRPDTEHANQKAQGLSGRDEAETAAEDSSQLTGNQDAANAAGTTGTTDSRQADAAGDTAGESIPAEPPVKQAEESNMASASSDNPKPKGDGKATAPSRVQEESIQLKVGDYIRFGRYNGQPIDWLVIHVNSNGQPLLLSSKILTLKPFDASESGTYNSTGDITFDNKMPREQVYTHYTPEDLRAMKGSNAWVNSNIREWLNSDQKKVRYSTQPPGKEAVWYGLNDYDKEMGFLYNFTEQEKAMIQTVRHKTLVAETDKAMAAGGNAPYRFSRASLEDVLFNADQAYYMEVEDRVFLLSVEEAIEYLYDEGHLLTAYPTDEAIRRDESGWYKDLKNQAGGAFMWWLRTPNAQTPCEVCIVGVEGNIIYSDYAVLCGIGVRPALYLRTSRLAADGTGTGEDPYVMK